MGKRDGRQKGAQKHAEGEHGEKTHAAFVEGLHRKLTDDEELAGRSPTQGGVDAFGRPVEGRHRLAEDRQQHDEAEKNSEANRLRH